jgi:hypothetical protein
MKRPIEEDKLEEAQHYLKILKERQSGCLACKEGDCSQIKHDCVDLELSQEIQETELEIKELSSAKVGRVCEACEQEVLNQAGHNSACDSLALPAVKAVVDEIVEALSEAVQFLVKSPPKEVVDLSEDDPEAPSLSVAEEVALEFPPSNSPVYHD